MLVDNGETVAETTCIIEHLQARHAGPNAWIPDGDTGRRVRFLDRFFDLYVMNTMTVAVFNAIRPADNRDPYGVEKALTQLRTAYDWLEANPVDGPWAVGDLFTLAACAAAPSLFYLTGSRRSARPPRGSPAYRARCSLIRSLQGGRRGPSVSPFYSRWARRIRLKSAA